MSATAGEQRRLAAIMFTDMVGYSALAQRNEALALELLEEHRRIVRRLLPMHGGREVETTGDGFLVEFASALAAVQFAVAVQQELHERNETCPAERQVFIRIGIHVGDILERGGSVLGDGVNIAARIEPLAAPGGICVSEDVARQVRNKLPHPLVKIGPRELKNIELPVVICRVGLPWEPVVPDRAPTRRRQYVRMMTAVGSVVLLVAVAVVLWPKHPLSTSITPIERERDRTNELPSLPFAPIRVELDTAMRNIDIDVDLVGVNQSNFERWQAYPMSKYWWLGDAMRKDAAKRVFFFRAGSDQWTQALLPSDPICAQWQSRGVTHVFVLADLPGAFSDETGTKDPRRQILRLNPADWSKDTKEIVVSVKTSGVEVVTPMRKN